MLAAGAATRFGGPKQRLLLPRVLERLQNCVEPPVPSLPQELDLPFVSAFDRVNERALLFGIELRPMRQLPPPALEAREEVLHEPADSAFTGG